MPKILKCMDIYDEPTTSHGDQKREDEQRPQAVLIPAKFGFRRVGLVGGHFLWGQFSAIRHSAPNSLLKKGDRHVVNPFFAGIWAFGSEPVLFFNRL